MTKRIVECIANAAPFEYVFELQFMTGTIAMSVPCRGFIAEALDLKKGDQVNIRLEKVEK